MSRLLTIGHSNVELERLVSLLKGQAVEVLVDVRSQPGSRFASQFSRVVLERELPAQDVRYVFHGKELGGRPKDRSCYDAGGYVLYGRQSRTPSFLAGIKSLEALARDYRTAIMCSEEDPSGCHRHLLIARVLSARGWLIEHIRGDGTLQPYASMVDVLSRDHSQATLFSEETNEDLGWRSLRSVRPSAAPPSSSVR